MKFNTSRNAFRLSVCLSFCLTISATRLNRLSCNLESTYLVQRLSDVRIFSPLVSNRESFSHRRASSEIVNVHIITSIRSKIVVFERRMDKERNSTSVVVRAGAAAARATAPTIISLLVTFDFSAL